MKSKLFELFAIWALVIVTLGAAALILINTAQVARIGVATLAPAPTAVVEAPTEPPPPTYTPYPTYTPAAEQTPYPTYTPYPTAEPWLPLPDIVLQDAYANLRSAFEDAAAAALEQCGTENDTCFNEIFYSSYATVAGGLLSGEDGAALQAAFCWGYVSRDGTSIQFGPLAHGRGPNINEGYFIIDGERCQEYDRLGFEVRWFHYLYYYGVERGWEQSSAPEVTPAPMVVTNIPLADRIAWQEACVETQRAVGDDDVCPSALDGGPPTSAQVLGVSKSDMPAPTTRGGLSWYAPGVFRRVVDPANEMSAIDLTHDELAAYDGFIAVADCALVGREATLLDHRAGRSFFVLVADCAAPIHKDDGYIFLVANGLIGEVDWGLAEEIGLPGARHYEFEIMYHGGGS